MKLRKLRHSQLYFVPPKKDWPIKMKEVALVFLLSTLAITERTPRQAIFTPLLISSYQNGYQTQHLAQQNQNAHLTPYYSFWLNTAAAAAQPQKRSQTHYPAVQLQILPLNSQYSYGHLQHQHQHQPHLSQLYQLPLAWNQLHLGQNYLQQSHNSLHGQHANNYYQHQQQPQQQQQHLIWPPLTANQNHYYQLQHQHQHQSQQQNHHQQNEVHQPIPQHISGDPQHPNSDDSEIVEAAHEEETHAGQHDQSDAQIQTNKIKNVLPPRDFSNYNFDFSNLGAKKEQASVEPPAPAAHFQNDKSLAHWQVHEHDDQTIEHVVDVPPRDFSDYNFDFSNLGTKEVLHNNSTTHLNFQRGHVELGFEIDADNKLNSFVDNISPFADKGLQRGNHMGMHPPPPSAAIRNVDLVEWDDLIDTNNGNVGGGGFNRGAVEARASTSGMSWKDRSAVTYQTGQENYRVICYFANWGWFREEDGGRYVPEYVDSKLCTHIIYAYATYDRNKIAIKASEPTVDEDNKFYERVVGLKRTNPKLKVLLAIGGWADSSDSKYSALANSEINRRKFARECVNYLQKYGFDGVSIDWHYPVCWQSDCHKGPKSDKNGFTDLLYELKMALGPERLLVAASLSGYKEVIDAAYDVPKISEYLDFMNIMTYDYHGSWESRTGHLSPLFAGPQAEDLKRTYNSDFTMEYYVSKGADSSKLILGIPLYGQSFTLENQFDSSLGSLAVGPGKAGDFTRQEGMLAYYEICKFAREDGWKVRKSSTGSHGPYAHKGNQWVGYDDIEFVKRKALYVKTKSFGGAFVFTLDLDDFTNVCCGGDHPLLRTLADELLGIPFNSRKQGCSGTSQDSQDIEMNPVLNTNKTHKTLLNSYKDIVEVDSTPDPEAPVSSSVWWVPDSTSVRPSTVTWWPPPQVSTSNRPQIEHTPQPEPCISQSPTIIRPTPNVSESVVNTPSPVQKPMDMCQYISKPHPTDCGTYYMCHSGQEIMQVCPHGLHWNQNAMTCDWPANAKCASYYPPSTAPPPPAITHPPSTYPPTTQPPPTTMATRAPPTTRPPTHPPQTIPPSPNPVAYCHTEGEYSQATNCDQYYLCSNGINKLQTCGPGLHWNNERKLCDWPSEARCQLRHDGPGTSDPDGDSCQDGSFAASPEACDVYFVCVHGQFMKFRCPGELHWNSDQKICDWPQNAHCKVTQSIAISESPTTSRPTTVAWPWTSSTTQFPIPPQATSTLPPVPSFQPPGPPAPPQYPVTQPPQPSELSGDYKIVCYFTNWAWYRPGLGKFKPEDINADLCTHIVYGFAVLDTEQLTIKMHDSWADIDNKFYEQVTALKRKGKKVTIAIGGWNDSAGDKYSRLVNNAAARRRFIQHVMEFIKANNFDGLDLDWEYPKCWQVECNKGPESDKPNFATFVRELSEAFRPYNLLLSAAVSPSKMVIDAGYDVPTISKYMDWIAVMTYDFHGQWDKKTGHVAPLYFHEEDDFYYFNANYSINYWINQGADRKKIVMGMPLYGQSFTLTNPAEHGLNAPSTGGGTAGEYTRASGFLATYEICNNIQRNGWTVVKDETGAMGPYAYKGNQWVSFDDIDMIRRKSELIRKLDLGGGMIWALDLDDFRNTCGQGEYPLLKTINSVLGKRKGVSDETATISWIQDKPNQPVKTETTVVESSSTTTLRPTLKPEQIEHCTVAFKPHEKDCSKYYQCLFGRYMEQSCSPGTVWNKDRCDWPRNTDCGNTGVKPPTTQRPIVVVQTTTAAPPPPSTIRPTSMAPSTHVPSTQEQQHHHEESTTIFPIIKPTTEYFPTRVDVSSFAPTSYRPPRRSTTPTPTKDPEWCRLNWCPTPKPIPPNKHVPVNMAPSDYKVVCYFTNWAWYRQGAGKYLPSDVDFNLCTHIIYGFAVLNQETLVIRPHDSWADIDNQFYKQVTQLRAKGIIVMLALGGWNDSLGDKYSRLANNPAARKRFIDHAITFIEEWDFDGLDLDWEYPKCWQVDCEKGPASDKPAFSALLKELKEAFEPRGLLLSSAVSPNHKVIDEGYDVPSVSRYLDWIAVMTYDYHGQFDGRTGHNSPMYAHPEDENQLFNTNFTINYWIQNGADRKKIVMGMPMYGQSFTLVNASNTGLNSKSSGGAEAGEFTRSKGFLAYYEICNYVQKKGWTVVQDQLGTMGPYAYKGDQWVSFDDIDQIRRKSEYIKNMGLGGGMIWALDLDDFRGVCGCEEHPLLKTINRVLRNYPEPDPKCRF